MVIEILLKIILVVVAISFVQIAYNSLVYRQRGKMKWFKFICVAGVTLVGGYILFASIKPFTELPYVSNVVSVIDTMIFTVYSYLPKPFLILWFVAPLVITWIVYLFITLTTVIRNRYKFLKWKKRMEEKEKSSSDNKETNKGTIDNSPVDAIELNADYEKEESYEKNVHFLSEPMTKIRYKSILGLQRAYEVAKVKGLQLTETENGYAAVYADKSGVRKLKELMTQNGIDYSKLENRPSVVFFDLDTVQCVSIKEALGKMKEGEPVV